VIDLKLEIQGADRAIAWLGSAPARLRLGMVETVVEGTGLELAATEAGTPHRTGWLASSERSRVEITADGARGFVFTEVPYARYQEHGTRFARARHMFGRGGAESRPPIGSIFNRNVGKVTGDLR
jgi:hypothetical protein